jgi:hypothetical protein
MKPFLLLLCLWLSATALFAQSDSLFVNQQPFSGIEGPVISISFGGGLGHDKRLKVFINYGQDCREIKGNCRQLRTLSGEPFGFDTAVGALNWFEAYGWQLVGIAGMDEGSSGFFFRRKE